MYMMMVAVIMPQLFFYGVFMMFWPEQIIVLLFGMSWVTAFNLLMRQAEFMHHESEILSPKDRILFSKEIVCPHGNNIQYTEYVRIVCPHGNNIQYTEYVSGAWTESLKNCVECQKEAEAADEIIGEDNRLKYVTHMMFVIIIPQLFLYIVFMRFWPEQVIILLFGMSWVTASVLLMRQAEFMHTVTKK